MELLELLSQITEELCIKLIMEFDIPEATYLVHLGNYRTVLTTKKFELITLNAEFYDSNVHFKIDESLYPSSSADIFMQVFKNNFSSTINKYRQISFEALKEKIEECSNCVST